LTLAGAVAAVVLRQLIHGALCLAFAFFGLALLYLQLGAQFIGLVQVLVYVGAVAILMVFAILADAGCRGLERGRWSRCPGRLGVGDCRGGFCGAGGGGIAECVGQDPPGGRVGEDAAVIRIGWP
jgi:hypothetical protein